MNPRQRQILELLEDRGACSYQELAERFEVSTMTIRRDVDDLGAAVIKTLGGVQRADAPAGMYETALLARLGVNRTEKRAIAAAALRELITSPLTLFLDGSTTCLELARLIARHRSGLTVVTNSALISLEVGRGEANRVICLGGQYDPASASFVGHSAEEAAARFFVDLAVCSTKGFIASQGTFESSVANFRIKQIIARQSARVALLVDHSKFGKRALCKVLDIKQIGVVVTDRAASARDLRRLRAAGPSVIVAEESARRGEVHAR